MAQQAKPVTSFPLPPLAAYRERVEAGLLTADAAQETAMQALSALHDAIIHPPPPTKGLRKLLATQAPVAHGLYLWGDVGRGKSMLMDIFVESLESNVCKTPSPYPSPSRGREATATPSRVGAEQLIKAGCFVHRVHFHAFMLDVHKRLHALRQIDSSGDLMPKLIAGLASEMRVLCLDEFQVTDVTDAMILSRLFFGLMEAGVAVVFTSNRPPRDLYQGGLQRDQFLKFVALVEKQLRVVELKSPHDYRLAQLQAMKRTYMYPRDGEADDFLMESWAALTGNAPSQRLTLEVQGRALFVEKQAHGVAWLTFGELCVRPLGSADYLTLAKVFHTILLQGIPEMNPDLRNEAKRFVTLIDALYDHRVKLIATAAVAPDKLYPAGDGSFEFARTASRLMEMQSEQYLALGHIS